ncbi:hypothetical protein [Pseudoalteromonas pernae]|uniref:hypothetical protein n=1 Tax=Pseudoalteromonas pernae TaxID=3118054 RepID=UPI0032428561
MSRYFINVMRYDNWLVDQERDLSLLAIGDSKVKFASSFEVGDKIITYVSSRKSCFTAIRTITSGDMKLSKKDLGYDEPYFRYIDTKADVILEEHKWLPIKSMLGELELTKGKKYWMNMFMGAIKEISIEDFQVISKKFEGLNKRI